METKHLTLKIECECCGLIHGVPIAYSGPDVECNIQDVKRGLVCFRCFKETEESRRRWKDAHRAVLESVRMARKFLPG